jgi:DNA polymerase-3 subunit epsilon
LKREVVLDTETTGLNAKGGHRIVEIGCVELLDGSLTGNTFHTYINPERDISAEASAVSGIYTHFLLDKPKFADIAKDFCEFIDGSILIIHNARFDLSFINEEFRRLSIRPFLEEDTIDTVKLSRKKFPGSPASLDALCKRFKIDLSSRSKHGALIDAQLLAQVYLKLIGVEQKSIFDLSKNNNGGEKIEIKLNNSVRPARSHLPSEDELWSHSQTISQINNSMWSQY